jgi:hypothetical protein
MLVAVVLVVGPEVLAGPFAMGRMEGQGVEFVVAHDRESSARLDHRPDDLERLVDLGAAVDEVAEENGLAVGVPVNAVLPRVAERLQELLESVSVAVDVADQVMHETALDEVLSDTRPSLLTCHEEIASVEHGYWPAGATIIDSTSSLKGPACLSLSMKPSPLI